MQVMRAFFFSLILPMTCLYTNPTSQEQFLPFEPWLIGPFTAPAASNLKPGQISFLNSITYLHEYGVYDSDWKHINKPDVSSLTFSIQFQQGLTEKTGIAVTGAYSIRCENDLSSKQFNDTFLMLGYQLSEDDSCSWIPDFMVWAQVIFPTGTFEDPTDDFYKILAFSGQGALFLGPKLAYQKQFAFSENIFILHLGFGYNFPFKTHLRELSIYGGSIETNGTLRPGHLINTSVSFEYAFNQRWALATDVFLTYQTATSKFKGFQGLTPEGTPAKVGLPSSTQLSLTPSIEYSHTSKVGWLIGSWVTIAGRNASAFTGGFLCLSATF